MPTRTAEANWGGSLMEGKGTLSTGSKAFSGPYDWKSRSGEGSTTNPEELLGAAHAGCFSMYLAGELTKAGHPPTRITTTAQVHLGEGPRITLIELLTAVSASGLDDAALQTAAQTSKEKCPISLALAATEIKMTARLSD